MISQNDRIVIGVSGGPDSMALLHFLYYLCDKYSLYIHAAHLNHMLRGQESESDTGYVREFCNKLHIPCSIRYVDIDEMSKSMGLSLEEAGRKARYDFFMETAKEAGASKIALAHNMNDQAETILLRIMRGTGLEGLCGIKPVRDGVFIRPLIYTRRSEIEDYCEVNNINPRIDSTNLKPIYARNIVRLELIPYIKEKFNPNIENVLSSMAELMRCDDDFLKGYTSRIYEEIAIKSENKIDIDLIRLKNIHDSIKKRVLRMAVADIRGNLTGIENKHVSLIQSIIDLGFTGAAVELPGGIRAEISYNNIVISKGLNALSKDFSYVLPVPGMVHIKEIGCTVQSEVLDSNVNFKSGNKFIKYFDYDRIKGNLVIRPRREGDFIVPLGSSGRKKVKEIFIDSKVPRVERDKIPLVLCDGDIIWVVGYRTSDSYKIGTGTKKILKLEFYRGGL